MPMARLILIPKRRCRQQLRLLPHRRRVRLSTRTILRCRPLVLLLPRRRCHTTSDSHRNSKLRRIITRCTLTLAMLPRPLHLHPLLRLRTTIPRHTQRMRILSRLLYHHHTARTHTLLSTLHPHPRPAGALPPVPPRHHTSSIIRRHNMHSNSSSNSSIMRLTHLQ